jgi:hypothetical protein
MITIVDQNVDVEFSKDGVGVIAVRAAGNVLSLQQLLVEGVKVGGTWKDGDEKPLPKVAMEFYKEESVDVVIKALLAIKKHLKYPYGTYALAC